jgi:hypothetical protein
MNPSAPALPHAKKLQSRKLQDTHRDRQTDRQTADITITITLLRVFLRHDLCSSIEACTNSSIWSNTSPKNVVLSDFFFRHDEDDDATACGADSVSTFTELCPCSLPLILAGCRFSFACNTTLALLLAHSSLPFPSLSSSSETATSDGRTDGADCTMGKPANHETTSKRAQRSQQRER